MKDMLYTIIYNHLTIDDFRINLDNYHKQYISLADYYYKNIDMIIENIHTISDVDIIEKIINLFNLDIEKLNKKIQEIYTNWNQQVNTFIDKVNKGNLSDEDIKELTDLNLNIKDRYDNFIADTKPELITIIIDKYNTASKKLKQIASTKKAFDVIPSSKDTSYSELVLSTPKILPTPSYSVSKIPRDLLNPTILPPFLEISKKSVPLLEKPEETLSMSLGASDAPPSKPKILQLDKVETEFNYWLDNFNIKEYMKDFIDFINKKPDAISFKRLLIIYAFDKCSTRKPQIHSIYSEKICNIIGNIVYNRRESKKLEELDELEDKVFTFPDRDKVSIMNELNSQFKKIESEHLMTIIDIQFKPTQTPQEKKTILDNMMKEATKIIDITNIDKKKYFDYYLKAKRYNFMKDENLYQQYIKQSDDQSYLDYMINMLKELSEYNINNEFTKIVTYEKVIIDKKTWGEVLKYYMEEQSNYTYQIISILINKLGIEETKEQLIEQYKNTIKDKINSINEFNQQLQQIYILIEEISSNCIKDTYTFNFLLTTIIQNIEKKEEVQQIINDSKYKVYFSTLVEKIDNNIKECNKNISIKFDNISEEEISSYNNDMYYSISNISKDITITNIEYELYKLEKFSYIVKKMYPYFNYFQLLFLNKIQQIKTDWQTNIDKYIAMINSDNFRDIAKLEELEKSIIHNIDNFKSDHFIELQQNRKSDSKWYKAFTKYSEHKQELRDNFISEVTQYIEEINSLDGSDRLAYYMIQEKYYSSKNKNYFEEEEDLSTKNSINEFDKATEQYNTKLKQYNDARGINDIIIIIDNISFVLLYKDILHDRKIIIYQSNNHLYVSYKSNSDVNWRFYFKNYYFSNLEKGDDYVTTTQIEQNLQCNFDEHYEQLPELPAKYKSDADSIYSKIQDILIHTNSYDYIFKNLRMFDHPVFKTLYNLCNTSTCFLHNIKEKFDKSQFDKSQIDESNIYVDKMKQIISSIRQSNKPLFDAEYKATQWKSLYKLMVDVFSEYMEHFFIIDGQPIYVCDKNIDVPYDNDPKFKQNINIKILKIDLLLEKENKKFTLYYGEYDYKHFITEKKSTKPQLNEKSTKPQLNEKSTKPQLNEKSTKPQLNEKSTKPKLNEKSTKYRIILGMIPSDSKITKYGLSEHYISAGIYIYKMFEYHQSFLIKGQVEHQNPLPGNYTFIGDLLNKMWPLNALDKISSDTDLLLKNIFEQDGGAKSSKYLKSLYLKLKTIEQKFN